MKGSKYQNDADTTNNNIMGESSVEESQKNEHRQQSRKLSKFRKNLRQKSVEDKVIPSKKWEFLESWQILREESFMSILVAWGKERGFYFLGVFCLLMCAVLFTLQAFMAFRSYQMLHQITTKRHIPDTLYQIYFGGHDWALDLDRVDLRANTSLFMH
ncbi:unnamed protein product [Candidula unifasciata]|uniref:Uncharacterized protein n=1 Tax=Candidula unifasciata TaxID=100452 RepID=A0A8S3YXH9_9EUPU|nr:unnamed protein product [Candidula unifasciata]